MKEKHLNIYEITILKDCPKDQIMKNAEEMVKNGLIRWVDKEKGTIEITGIGFLVEGIKRGKSNN